LTPPFYDKLSENLYNELPQTKLVVSKVMLNIEQCNVGENYITAKIQDNQGDPIIVNIQEGNYAIEL
jgi:hypothetical protein